MKKLVSILAQFLADPSGIHFANDILDRVGISLPSLYRILSVLESSEIIIKYRQAYTFNNFLIGDVNFYRNILPSLGKQHKYTAFIYLIKYLLFDLNSTHTVSELKILLRRPRLDIETYLDLLQSENLLQQKSDLLWSWELETANRLRKSGLITIHKNLWSPKNERL